MAEMLRRDLAALLAAAGLARGATAPGTEARAVWLHLPNMFDADPVKGKELARTQIEKGADIIFAAAGNSGLGAFDAVEQYGKDAQGRALKFVIGVDSNQNWVKPGYVLTSMVKRVDNAVYQIVRDRVEGRQVGGIHVYGLDNEGIGYAADKYNKDLLSPQIIRAVDEVRQKIISGQIKVTNAMEK